MRKSKSLSRSKFTILWQTLETNDPIIRSRNSTYTMKNYTHVVEQNSMNGVLFLCLFQKSLRFKSLCNIWLLLPIFFFVKNWVDSFQNRIRCYRFLRASIFYRLLFCQLSSMPHPHKSPRFHPLFFFFIIATGSQHSTNELSMACDRLTNIGCAALQWTLLLEKTAIQWKGENVNTSICCTDWTTPPHAAGSALLFLCSQIPEGRRNMAFSRQKSDTRSAHFQ